MFNFKLKRQKFKLFMTSQYEYNSLFRLLSKELSINKARLKCLSLLIIALLKVQTVNFTRLSEALSCQILISSNLRKLQRFFSLFTFDEYPFNRLILSMLPIKGKFKLSLDRTNWKFGATNINILFLCVIYDGVGLPILWTLLGDKRGNSNENERIALLNRFTMLFGPDKIEYLTADREFIGGKWWEYLICEQIPFYIRFRDNFDIKLSNNKIIKGHWLLRQSKINVPYYHPKVVTINGVYLYFSGMKYNENGKQKFIMIASYNKVEQSLEAYSKRWQIETMFKAFKSSGFNLEDTHLKDYEKINKLLYIISLAFIWSYNVGIYLHENEKPIKIKKHGRREKSFFKYGLQKLAQVFLNKDIKQVEMLTSKFLSCT